MNHPGMGPQRPSGVILLISIKIFHQESVSPVPGKKDIIAKSTPKRAFCISSGYEKDGFLFLIEESKVSEGIK